MRNQQILDEIRSADCLNFSADLLFAKQQIWFIRDDRNTFYKIRFILDSHLWHSTFQYSFWHNQIPRHTNIVTDHWLRLKLTDEQQIKPTSAGFHAETR